MGDSFYASIIVVKIDGWQNSIQPFSIDTDDFKKNNAW